MDTDENNRCEFISELESELYGHKLYKYLCHDKDDKRFNLIYHTDANTGKNDVYCLDKVKQNGVENTLYIKLKGYGDYQISIYKINKSNKFIETLMKKCYHAHINAINSYLCEIKRREFYENNIYFDRVVEYEKIKSKINENKCFVPKNFEQMCLLLNMEIKAFLDIDCEFENTFEINIKNNTVFDVSNNSMNINKLLFNSIFKHKYSDMINFKIIEDDGNFTKAIIEFEDNYFVLDYDTS